MTLLLENDAGESDGGLLPALEIEGLSKRFGTTEAVADMRLTVPQGSLTVLLGPAGAGKTTTLRLVAGLDSPDAGRIVMRGRDVGSLQPKDRDVAMIFDNLALYPNRTGFENIASPLTIRGTPRDVVETEVKAMAATLRIPHVLYRLPRTMSGGERQRVALGRALIRKPGLFLLDEPLSSLDAMLRIELRAELKRLQRVSGHTFLLATPDFAEAMAVADIVVMLRAGRVIQVADAQSLYDGPADRDVARFVGAPEINLLHASLHDVPNGTFRLAGGTFGVPPHLAAALATIGSGFEAGLRPEYITLADPATADLRGALVDIEPLGLRSALTVANETAEIRMVADAADIRALRIGATLGLNVATDHLIAFDPVSGKRL